MQLHDILLLRTSASLHSVSVDAKPLSTGQYASCRRLYHVSMPHFRSAPAEILPDSSVHAVALYLPPDRLPRLPPTDP